MPHAVPDCHLCFRASLLGEPYAECIHCGRKVFFCIQHYFVVRGSPGLIVHFIFTCKRCCDDRKSFNQSALKTRLN